MTSQIMSVRQTPMLDGTTIRSTAQKKEIFQRQIILLYQGKIAIFLSNR